MATHIVGLMGKKRSGKDTFAAHLVENYGFTRFAFADILKNLALDVNPIVGGALRDIRLRELIEHAGWESAKEYPAVREFLQNLGVAVRDHLGGESWIRPVANAVAYCPGPVVITDVRFPNEGDFIRRARGSLVRITKIGQVDNDPHVSETLMDTYPAQFTVVAEAGALDHVRREADFLARALGIHRRVFPIAA